MNELEKTWCYSNELTRLCFQTEDNNVVVYLKSMLGHLTLNPGDYEQVVNPVGDALQPVVADEAVRNSICDVIVDEVRATASVAS